MAGTKNLDAIQARIASGVYAGAQFYAAETQAPPSVFKELRAAFAEHYRLVRMPDGAGDLYLP